MKARSQDDYVRTALRVPPELHAQIHKSARAAGRTFNAELIHILQSHLEDQIGGDAELKVGVSLGLNEPKDRAAILKTLLLEELMLLRSRVADLGGRDAVLKADKFDLVKQITGPRIEGSTSERQSHFSQAVGSYPLTTLLTTEELGKLAERIMAAQAAMHAAKPINPAKGGTKKPKP